ncbi:hypothetical protein AU210_010948 [Fusarium oxysporum f. sp. radicis-cucumerinum]|uniref:RING-type domain-containing protein n=1 Tax=Fusarium oxysporum f. sp. radicis-cucumerinum TaxID=327505 RepID=A0A2H3H0F5_FUSOX|nr:hypothetical protein AU210_010948 [Fusarium oxysporum f. sp. radicis-cucumerinum]
MFPFKNIFQRLKGLSASKSPPKEAQPHPFASSQTLEFITKVNANPNCPFDPQIENHANKKAESIVTESFWPNIRKHILADDPNAKPMKAICAICWDELHVTCISYPNDELEIALVAPCGHIMCPKC